MSTVARALGGAGAAAARVGARARRLAAARKGTGLGSPVPTHLHRRTATGARAGTGAAASLGTVAGAAAGGAGSGTGAGTGSAGTVKFGTGSGTGAAGFAGKKWREQSSGDVSGVSGGDGGGDDAASAAEVSTAEAGWPSPIDPHEARFSTEIEVRAIRAPRKEIGGLMALVKSHTISRPRQHKVVHLEESGGGRACKFARSASAYPYTLAASSFLALQLVPCLFAHIVPVYPYTLAASFYLACARSFPDCLLRVYRCVRP
jgi:hypothetical protein